MHTVQCIVYTIHYTVYRAAITEKTSTHRAKLRCSDLYF